MSRTYASEAEQPDTMPPDAPTFVRGVLDWFAANARDYPWRRTRDAYPVLVAEFMLQQTTADQVAAMYQPFLTRYPTPALAAAAPESEIVAMLKPLGLVHRARLLKRALEHVTHEHDGAIPCSLPELLLLPGVGPYTARAVMCFAFGHDLAAVDVNVIRVLGRALGLTAKTTRPHRDRRLWRAVDALIPGGSGRDFNLAMLDFAALVCTHSNPRCASCPVRSVCRHAQTSATTGDQRGSAS